MTEFAYTQSVSKIKPLLQKIHDIRVPDKVSVKWLESIGFTSSADRTLTAVLKQISFVDSAGTPTQFWQQYRSVGGPALAEAIQAGYSVLYQTYPDAQARDDQELNTYFKSQSSHGAKTVSRVVNTFLALVREADFASAVAHSQGGPKAPQPTRKPQAQPAASGMPAVGIPIHVDVQVHISPDMSADQIDQVFKSMATHLAGLNGG